MVNVGAPCPYVIYLDWFVPAVPLIRLLKKEVQDYPPAGGLGVVPFLLSTDVYLRA